MRVPNYKNISINRASVTITSTLYDRRALDCTSLKPLVNSLNNLTFLASSSSKIRDTLTNDGGLLRLIDILSECYIENDETNDFKFIEDNYYKILECLYNSLLDGADVNKLMVDLNNFITTYKFKQNLQRLQKFNETKILVSWKWTLSLQVIVLCGTRGNEFVRNKIVNSDMIPIMATVLYNYLLIKNNKVKINYQGSISLPNIDNNIFEKDGSQLNIESTKILTLLKNLMTNIKNKFRKNDMNTEKILNNVQGYYNLINKGIPKKNDVVRIVALNKLLVELLILLKHKLNSNQDACSDANTSNIPKPSHDANGTNEDISNDDDILMKNLNDNMNEIKKFIERNDQTILTNDNDTANQDAEVPHDILLYDDTGTDAGTNGAYEINPFSNLSNNTENSYLLYTPPREFYNGKIVPAEDDITWILQLLAFISKYSYMKNILQFTYIIPRLSLRNYPNGMINNNNSKALNHNGYDGVMFDGKAINLKILQNQILQTHFNDNQPINFVNFVEILKEYQSELDSLQNDYNLMGFKSIHNKDLADLIELINEYQNLVNRVELTNNLSGLNIEDKIIKNSDEKNSDDSDFDPKLESKFMLMKINKRLNAFFQYISNLNSKFMKLQQHTKYEKLKSKYNYNTYDFDNELQTDINLPLNQFKTPIIYSSISNYNKDIPKIHSNILLNTTQDEKLFSLNPSLKLSKKDLDYSNIPLDYANIFGFIEIFTLPHFMSSINHWAGVIMRNSCRKNELKNGIRQCSNTRCGEWELEKKFSKCKKCRRAKYCSRDCQIESWKFHKYWCQSPSNANHGHSNNPHNHGSSSRSAMNRNTSTSAQTANTTEPSTDNNINTQANSSATASGHSNNINGFSSS